NKTLWTSTIYVLRDKQLLPVVCFVFSRKRCDDYLELVKGLDLNSQEDKHYVSQFFRQALSRLNESDRQLQQVINMQEMAKRGIAIHHSGVLPILRESVELLFQTGRIKVLFATETFAMGINMPARTVLFDSLQKHDGKGFRELIPSEYIQMAGRAGRRGLDKTGTVIALCKGDVPSISSLKGMILGKSAQLQSQFRLTYSMILNFLRVAECPLEYMVSSSYSEYHSQKANARDIIATNKLRSTIETLHQSIKSFYTDELKNYFHQCQQFWNIIFQIQQNLINHDKISHRLLDDLLKCGRIIRIRNIYEIDIPAIVLDGSFNSTGKNINHQRIISVLIISQSTNHLLTDLDRLILKENEQMFILPVQKWNININNSEQEKLIYQIKNINITDLLDITNEIIPNIKYNKILEDHWNHRMNDTFDIELESTIGYDKGLRQAIEKLKLIRQNSSNQSIEVRPLKKDDKNFSNKQDLTLFLIESDIYFLFNPWNKDDACALSSSEQINEYVMNEHGQIYLGTPNKPLSIPWYFGQFEQSTLLTAFALLDQAQLPTQNRIDPSIIIRIISSKICSNPGTNNGIFPSSHDKKIYSSENHGYTSSTSIFKQYILSNCQSLQGGCGNNWQHAAILCSLSRSLGIPCRIVTIYNTACQTDGTQNNDIHWDTKQRPLQKLNSDIICSSHVWNECWMRRHDLPKDEQDWQIVDSTPVQMCDGIRRTGPCSISSLRNGELSFRWDSLFIHSTINGNKLHWIVYPDGYMELLDVQENIIGTKIITRSLNNEFEPEDITKTYKNLKKLSDRNDNLAERTKNDVDIELKISDDIEFGDNIILELNANNKSNEIRTITTALTIFIISSNNQKLIFSHEQPIHILNLEAGKNDNIQLKITPQQYIYYGKQDNIIVKYYIHSLIKETDQTFTRDDNIVFNKNDIIKPILDEDVIETGKPILLGIQIANSLSRQINNGRIYIDGLGINQIVPVNRSFAPKESTILHIKLYPTRIGVSRLYITFISDDVYSSTQIIPLEILHEPIKEQNEPLLKTNTETLSKTDEKVDKQTKENEPISSSNISDQEDKTLKNEEQQQPLKILSTKISDEYPDDRTSNISPTKFDLSSADDDDVDDIEELNLKKNQDESSPNQNTDSSLPQDLTLSLDKDKISVDSLDGSHDRRHETDNKQQLK
ncbi:unnamed protein product, partial [Rotaria sordida]